MTQDDEVQKLGIYIKTRRVELGLSLRDLSSAANLSATFLSSLERGIANPTLDSLRKISTALNTPILYMANNSREGSPVVRRHQRGQLKLSNGHLLYEILTPSLNKKMVVMQARITPDDGNIVVGPLSEPTEECIVMLSGQINIVLAGQSFDLEEGDSIYFDGKNLESLSALGDTEATYISVITPPVF